MTTMDRAARAAWIDRGFKDPVVAYRQHAASAAKRGIAFHLTFAQWWELWEPHYEQRGQHAGQKCMCRAGDKGAYELGNVRIDTIKGNAEERSRVYRAANLQRGRLATAEQRHSLATQAPDDWLTRRGWVFKPYTEDDAEDVGRT